MPDQIKLSNARKTYKPGGSGISYLGGKGGMGVYDKIINLMPPHETYVEPFLGGGAIMRLKRPALRNIGIDLDAAAIQAMHRWARSLNVESGVTQGSLELTKPPAATPALAISADTVESGVRRRSLEMAVADPLAESVGVGPFEFSVENGITWLRDLAELPFLEMDLRQTLVYCDPPYLSSVRPYNGHTYNFEMSDVDHRHLLDIIRGLKCRVMISGYHSKLYETALKRWNSITFQAMTRGGKPATEWLWYNYPAPTELHDYRFLGRGFRERERIKRKKARWVARLQRMPLLERQALLAAIAGTVGNDDGIRQG